MPIPRSITVDLTVDLDQWRMSSRPFLASLAYTMVRLDAVVARAALASPKTIAAAVRADEEAARTDYLAQIENAVLTDARDFYYTARDLTEEPR